MARLLRILTGGYIAVVLGVALLFPPTAALAGPTFLLGGPNPCPTCKAMTFDGSGLAQGTAVTTQFAADGATFLNVQYDDGSLGQSSAPGFSGGGLVDASGGDIVITFAGLRVFAAFAYADVGWDPCCGGRTFSAYRGGQLVASTHLPLRPARFLTVAGTYPAAAAADAEYSRALDKVAADNLAVQSQTAIVAADQTSLDAAIQAVVAAQLAFTLDYVQFVLCNNPVCEAIYLAFLAADVIALNDASDRANAAAARLQTDQAQLAALQAQLQLDQLALDEALSQKAWFDAAYEEALADEPGPGFIGFSGATFDTLVLSGLGSLGDLRYSTVIDTLVAAPEPSTAALMAGALAALLGLRRIRRKPGWG